jgi:hypothetical protein
MPNSVGDILKKRSTGEEELPDSLELLGIDGTNWSATDAEEFSAAFSISTHDLYVNYTNTDGGDVPAVDEYTLLLDPAEREAAKQRLTEAMNKANRLERQRLSDARSPEDVFRESEAASEADANASN